MDESSFFFFFFSFFLSFSPPLGKKKKNKYNFFFFGFSGREVEHFHSLFLLTVVVVRFNWVLCVTFLFVFSERQRLALLSHKKF